MNRDRTVEDILRDPECRELVRRRNTVAFVLTAIHLLVYLAFLAMVAYAAPFLARTVGGVPIGIPLAAGVIFVSWGLTGIYSWWANRFHDRLVRRIRDRAEGW